MLKYKCSNLIVQHKGKRYVRPIRCLSNGTHIDPDFFHAFSTSLCGSYGIEESRKCMHMLDIPPIDEQINIMDTLRDISNTVDITLIQGPLMNLIVHHDYEKAAKLLKAFVEYQHTFEHLKTLAQSSLIDISRYIDIV
uniref:Uncharacterized protein n=1 Tax=viral metagenome TaxID=1070528 RepID=A0A6C0BGC0_9ZZZZ